MAWETCKCKAQMAWIPAADAYIAGRGDQKSGMTIPNYITILRLLLVPFVVWAMLDGRELTALLGFVAAGISDGVDGFIARRWNMKSELGAYLDPVADKLLLVSVFVVLAYQGLLPLWLVAIVVFRDALIVSAVMLSAVMDNPVEMRPLFVSKANTAAQILLAALVLAVQGFSWETGWPVLLLFGIVALLTAASTAAYLVTWLKHMADYGKKTS
jgi:cardiolipin synthase (CMP-forming)